MGYLFLVSFIWAFSFPLIGHYLVGAGGVDAQFVVVARFFLAFLAFLPFLFFSRVGTEIPKSWPLRAGLMAIGAVQIGVMYLFYFRSFEYLAVYEVALFTVFTPFFVSAIYDIWHKRWSLAQWGAVVLCVVGAAVVKYGGLNEGFWTGFWWIQGANLCFGAGQIAYKILINSYENRGYKIAQRAIFGYFYAGALVVGAASWLAFGDTAKMPQSSVQWAIIVYLGLIASGLGYFWWNKGASMVSSGALAIMNNVVVPLAVAVNALFWGGGVGNVWQFFAGSALIALALFWHYSIIKSQNNNAKNTKLC